MKLSLAFVAIAIVATPQPCNGAAAFLSLPFVNQPDPDIAQHAAAQESALLKIHLDIAQEVGVKNREPVLSGNRLGVEGLTIELKGGEDAKYKHPNLPGANGPNPQLSSGAKTLDLLREGKFVDLTGTQRARLENGAWEITWKNNAKAGSLICGFDVPEAIKRNDAMIPKGRVYMAFPVFTDETLSYLRERKVVAEEKAIDAIDRLRNTHIQMAKSSNPLRKAMHFRDAMKAHEDIEYSGYHSYNRMPIERDMIPLAGGLHLCSRGSVWTKKEGWFGDQVLLGTASVSEGAREESEKKVLTERELKSVAFDGLRPLTAP